MPKAPACAGTPRAAPGLSHRTLLEWDWDGSRRHMVPRGLGMGMAAQIESPEAGTSGPRPKARDQWTSAPWPDITRDRNQGNRAQALRSIGHGPIQGQGPAEKCPGP